MPQIDLDGLNSRLYINELRSQSTSTIVVPSSTTLTVDTLALTKLQGNVTVAAGNSITVADASGFSVGGAEIKPGGVKAWENKSATFTSVSGQSYIVDTSGGAFNVLLPAAPEYGSTVVFLDAAGTWGTNNLTLLGNGEKIVRVAGQDLAVDEDDTYIEMVYSGGTHGWLVASTNLVL
jgi:hypothetical protein